MTESEGDADQLQSPVAGSPDPKSVGVADCAPPAQDRIALSSGVRPSRIQLESGAAYSLRHTSAPGGTVRMLTRRANRERQGVVQGISRKHGGNPAGEVVGLLVLAGLVQGQEPRNRLFPWPSAAPEWPARPNQPPAIEQQSIAAPPAPAFRARRLDHRELLQPGQELLGRLQRSSGSFSRQRMMSDQLGRRSGRSSPSGWGGG